MFGLFKKKAKGLPSFQYLEDYANRDKYFVRTLQWDWLNDTMIHLFDNKAPRMITMDEWPQQVYLDAVGQKNTGEYILWMANQYRRGEVPETLDKDMIELIENLVSDGMIEWRDEKTILPYYLDGPKSEQDIDKAYELMVEDGYIKER